MKWSSRPKMERAQILRTSEKESYAQISMNRINHMLVTLGN